MPQSTESTPHTTSGSFLLHTAAPDEIFTPEDLGDDHRAIAATVDEFWARAVEPALPALLRREPGVARRLLREAGDLGLTAMQIPEAYGGLALDLSAVMVAVEHLADDASYLGWHLGHSGIGTLPLVYYGTADQKRRYLPRLAAVDLMAAYALTEPHAGSDPLAARTRADLSTDGRHYVLNGQKMWITNGGEADLFTVFAKVNGEAFTAFLVERAFGVTNGPQEHKMGLEGTSTTALYFDNVKVPVENVLGEVGRGHEIAFNVLNVGRLEIGALALRGAKKILSTCVAYAAERRAFGRPIGKFGAVQQMLARTVVRIFATESATWRAVGSIQAYQSNQPSEPASESEAGASNAAPNTTPNAPAGRATVELAAFEEFAAECAMVKVFASEMLDAVADDGVQIHGGYGYHRDYLVERAYRDARINRIFEGTNEINRVLIPGMLIKRASRHGLPLVARANAAIGLLTSEPPGSSAEPADKPSDCVDRARQLTLAMLGAARARYGDALRHQQAVAMAIADACIAVYTAEATALRAERLSAPLSERATGAVTGAWAGDIAAIVCRESLARVGALAERVFAATLDARPATHALQGARSLAATTPFDVIAAEQRLAQSLMR